MKRAARQQRFFLDKSGWAIRRHRMGQKDCVGLTRVATG